MDNWVDGRTVRALASVFDYRVAVIGYAAQGRAQAANLKDAGAQVVVGLRHGSSSWDKALNDGHKVMLVDDACLWADIIVLLIPDVSHQNFLSQYAKHIKDTCIIVAHGMSVDANWLDHPHVALVAPKAIGPEVRDAFVNKKPLLCVVSGTTDRARSIAIGYAAHIAYNVKVLEVSFREEAICDMFSEQAVLCGGLIGLIEKAYQTLVDKGYSKTLAYFECVREVELIAKIIRQFGVGGMLSRVSDAARIGGSIANQRMFDANTLPLKALLEDIEDGTFYSTLTSELNKANYGIIRERYAELDQIHQSLNNKLDS